jgi:hypothetical protein
MKALYQLSRKSIYSVCRTGGCFSNSALLEPRDSYWLSIKGIVPSLASKKDVEEIYLRAWGDNSTYPVYSDELQKCFVNFVDGFVAMLVAARKISDEEIYSYIFEYDTIELYKNITKLRSINRADVGLRFITISAVMLCKKPDDLKAFLSAYRFEYPDIQSCFYDSLIEYTIMSRNHKVFDFIFGKYEWKSLLKTTVKVCDLFNMNFQIIRILQNEIIRSGKLVAITDYLVIAGITERSVKIAYMSSGMTASELKKMILTNNPQLVDSKVFSSL